MAMSTLTRSKDKIWMIGHPCETLTGARLPSGRDVMRNFVYYHRLKKLTIADSVCKIYEQLLPFWLKSRLPVRQKQHVIQKLKDLYGQQVRLMSSRARGNDKDKLNQNQYTEKLDTLFDISHANADKLIANEEDRQFLKLQKESRTGCIGPVDKKLDGREKRSAQRHERFALRIQLAANTESQQLDCTSERDNDSASESDSDSSTTEEEEEEFVTTVRTSRSTREQLKRKDLVSEKVSAVLDRTNTSIRTSTMILASVVNEAGCSTSAAVLSKSTVHRHRQRCRRRAAEQIKENFVAGKSVVHWDGKLLPDVTGDDSGQVDRLPVLISSLDDGSTKLLGVPKLSSGSGRAAADAVHELLALWQCDSLIIGMCFDTTASNTGRVNGACTLLEASIGRPLLWMACRHHMFEVLLSDAFGVCFGPSTGPEILIFKRFRDKWSVLANHTPMVRQAPFIIVTDSLKAFIAEHSHFEYPRDDYREFICLAASMVGVETNTPIRKPGALHRARWMAKAIYSMKMELLFDGNEGVLKLTARELQGLQRFNRFVVCVYLQSWFTCRSTIDAPINDILLIQRLHDYDDVDLQLVGLKMMKRQSWYLSQELATLALFSTRLSHREKAQLILGLQTDRGEHLLTSLPRKVEELSISRTFFQIAGIDDSFLDQEVESWSSNVAYKNAEDVVKNLVCVNDCAERGVALIQTFNATVTKDESQKQYLLQVVEKHRKDFSNCNRDNLMDM